MNNEPGSKRRGGVWPTVAVIAMVAFLSFAPPGRALGAWFFASLRLAKPQPVNVNIPSFAGPNSSHQLEDLVSGLIADNVSVLQEEPDQPAAGVDVAGKLAGFAPALPRARKDSPTLIVVGARATSMAVNRDQLRTMLMQAGKRGVELPSSLEGATVVVRSPRAIRAQYGNCPAPAANTIQGQIQGTPPPTADNANCIVLIETPAAAGDVPAGLDMPQLVEIALELSGMSPNQTRAFQETFDWKSTLRLSLPRFMRSYDSVSVGGTPGILLNSVARRGPTYQLIWARTGMVYALTGYGNPADAVALASSVN